MAGSTGSRWYGSTLSLLAIVVAPGFVAAASAIPAPLIISPSQYWEGNDGLWSTFTLQVGTPAQDVRVLISTSGTATWVVVPQGCIDNGPSNCADLRGEEFNPNASSTWEFKNYYELGLESNLGYTGSGEFGLDKVGLGWQGSGGPVLDHQVVAGIATEDFWLGLFGLTPRPTNFTNFNNPQPSFVETLKNQSLIPSLAWSYTAGASYRFQKVLGSLIFGGYDASRAGSTNMSFGFAPDISKDLTVGLQSISTSMQGEHVELLPNSIFTFIDSTIPHIWLPVSACQKFEDTFGLTWNDTLGLYLVNDTLHNSLLSRNISFTFKIGNTTDRGPTIDIVLPYASFDLTVNYPIVSNQTRYFPLLRAENDTQYTLGRTFLQEAYLTVDYERSIFYLSQAQFNPGATQYIIAIPSINAISTGSTVPPSGNPISPGAIAGIAVGCSLFVIGLILAAAFFVRRKRKLADQTGQSIRTDGFLEAFGKVELDAAETSKELDAEEAASPGHEMDDTDPRIYEMSAIQEPTLTFRSPDRSYDMPENNGTLQELPTEVDGHREAG